MSSVLVGMFDTQQDATEARSALMAAGFAADTISMTGGNPAASAATATTTSASGEREPEGAVARFFRDIFGGGDDTSAPSRSGMTQTYEEAFRRGSYGLTVTIAREDDVERAEDILNDCGAVDIEARAESWRKEGWTGGALGAGVGMVEAPSTLEAGASRKLQEVEEELKVGKRTVAKGGVRVFTRMTEEEVSETVRLREEHADIRRTAVDRPATEADLAAFQAGSIEVREMAEEVVVSKTARVTGEVEVGKTATEREETVHDTLRKTRVDVEQIDGGSDAGTAGGVRVTEQGTPSSGMPGTGTVGSDNRDPITGEPGAHPVGTALGATAGGVAAGAAMGSIAGPVGTVAGAAVGAVAGGLAGKEVAETVDPTTGKPRPKP